MKTGNQHHSHHRIIYSGTIGISKHRHRPAGSWRVAAWLTLLAAVGLLTTGPGALAADKEVSPFSPLFKNTLPCVVDLTPYYNFKGDVGYGGFSGEQTLDGLPFNVAGHITLFGKTSAQRGAHDPHEVAGIKINRKFDELHLIHDAVWEDVVGQPVAVIRLHYADGTTNDLAIKYGVNVADWNRLISEETEMLSDPRSKIIRHYQGVNKGTGRLFATTLINPNPDVLVETMDLISADGWANYRLAAATVAQADPQRPVTRGLLLNMPPRHFDGELTVKAVDEATGEPVGNADVMGYVVITGEGVVIPPLLTTSDGEAIVKYPKATTSRLGVSISKKGYLGRRSDWQSGNIPTNITLKLVHAGASIQGRVTDESGQPVTGAQVRVINYSFGSGPNGNRLELPNNSVATDSDGHWSIDGFPKDYQDFGVSVSHPDFPAAQFFADGPQKRGITGAHIATADFFSGTAVLKLAGGKKLSGVVHDEKGNAVAGAAIFVGFDRYMSGAVKSQTDAEGGFSVKNLKPGENYLTVSAAGLAPVFRTISVEDSNAPLAVVLKPGKTIHGRVVDTAGKPIGGANVSYDGLANRQGQFTGRTIEWNTKTDSTGEFTWDSAPAEPVRLSLRKSGYMALEWLTVPTDTTNSTTYTLNPPLTVKGSVTDEANGQPVNSFTITPGWFWSGNGGQAQFQKYQAQSGSAGHYEVHFESPIVVSPTPYDFVFQLSAPGYAPEISQPIKADAGVVTWDVKLKKAAATVCTVKTADGKPASGVRVFLAKRQDYLQLDDTSVFSQNQDAENYETDASGHFALPPQAGDFSLVAASPAGFALASASNSLNSPTLTLQLWGRVEGRLLNHGRPLSGRELYFFIGDGSEQRNVWMRTPATVDAEGRFIFPHVPAGTIRIELKQPMNEHSWSYKELQTVEVKPGGTNIVEVTLNGRDLIGHWQRAADLPDEVNIEQGNFYLRPKVESPVPPKDLDSQEKIQKWYDEWTKTDAGKKFMEAQRKMANLQIKADGTLRGESVSPGKYDLSANFWGNGGTVAEVESREVEIPESPASDPDKPFDVGTFVVKPVKHLNVGEAAPDFSVKTLEDQPLKLSDYRGKYVLLDFWATWCGPCVAETPNLKATYDAYGSDSRFVMISLSLDQDTAKPKKFAQEHDIRWLQGFLGEWSKDTVTKDYCVRGIPAIFLVGPDGKIMAMNLRGETIKSTVGSALGAK